MKVFLARRKSCWHWLLATVLVGFMCLVHSHVKWFVEYDVTKAPLPICEVLTGKFIGYLLLSLVAVYFLPLYVQNRFYDGFRPAFTPF
jgi:hypothetical protein